MSSHMEPPGDDGAFEIAPPIPADSNQDMQPLLPSDGAQRPLPALPQAASDNSATTAPVDYGNETTSLPDHLYSMPASAMIDASKAGTQTGSLAFDANTGDDIMNHIPGMYKLLDLINDGVDKPVIHHESIKKICNKLQPGSYQSMSKIDFKRLDKTHISPIGIYGSRSRIAEWLLELGAVVPATASRLKQPKPLSDSLKPGLYLLEKGPPTFYVIFWPEDLTWESRDTTDAGKNRVLFMRFLTKLCDQIICLVSSEDSAKVATIEGWTDTSGPSKPPRTKLYKRTVIQTVSQQESATAAPGPTFLVDLQVEESHAPQVRLVGGSIQQGMLVPETQIRTASASHLKYYEKRKIRDLFASIEDPTARSIQIDSSMDRATLNRLGDLGLYDKFSLVWTSSDLIHRDSYKREETSRTESKVVQMVTFKTCLPELRRHLAEIAYGYLCQVYTPPCAMSWEKIEPTTTIGQDAVTHEFVRSALLIPGAQSKWERHLSSFEWTSEFKTDREAMRLWEEGLSNITKPRKERLINYLASRIPLNYWSTNNFSIVPEPLSPALDSDGDQDRMPRRPEPVQVEEDLTFFQSKLLPYLQRAWRQVVDDAVYIVQQEMLKTYDQETADLLGQVNVNFQARLIAALNTAMSRPKENSETVLLVGIDEGNIGKKPFSYRIVQKERPVTIQTLYQLSCGQGNHMQLNRLLTLESEVEGHIQHIQFWGQNYVLVLRATQNHLFAELQVLGSKHVKIAPLKFSLERLGDQYVFDIDDAGGRIAFVTIVNGATRLTIHEFDGRRFYAPPPAELVDFPFPEPAQICFIRFVPGSKMVLLVDAEGQVSLYSLATNQFRSSKLSLGSKPSHVQFTPNGRCVLISVSQSDQPPIWKAFHIASLADQPDGYTLGVHPFTQGTPPTFVHIAGSSKLHLMSFHQDRMHSWEVSIVSKSTDFDIQTSGPTKDAFEAVHAFLIYCFSEVWIRYPIVPTIERHRGQSKTKQAQVIFIANENPALLVQVFLRYLQEYGRKQHKPTNNRLSSINVSALTSFRHTSDASEFTFGDWLIGLFCLIPIHIAIAASNQFIPIKDGALSEETFTAIAEAEVEKVATK